MHTEVEAGNNSEALKGLIKEDEVPRITERDNVPQLHTHLRGF